MKLKPSVIPFRKVVRKSGGWIKLPALFVLLLLVAFNPAQAQTVQPCTEAGLDAAILAGGSHTFNCTEPTTITTSATKIIREGVSVTLDGSGLLTISGGNTHRVFTVLAGSLTLERLTISGGYSTAAGGITNSGTLTITNSTLSGNQASEDGGGIINFHTLTITNSTLSGNSAGFGDGGGIYNVGTLTITNSTLSGNSTIFSGGFGGGIYNADTGNATITITNSTLSGNSAHFGAGGGIYNAGTLTITNSTLSGNSSSGGGGIDSIFGTVAITNSIVANSTGGDCIGSSSYNATNNRATGECGDIAVTFLGPLADNGGPTLTHALLQGSNAIDAAIGGCPLTDQRGVARPQGNACDIGAYESPFDNTNRLPIAQDDVGVTFEDIPKDFDVLANDSDPDGDVLVVTHFTPTSHGSLTPTGNGVFTYTPDPNYFGGDTFTYEISDGYGGSDSAVVTITVLPVNDPPQLTVNQSLVIVDEGQTALNSGTVFDEDGPMLTLSASRGTVTDNGDGTWSWSFAATDGPNQNPNVTVTVNDGAGGTDTVSFHLLVINVAPTINSVNNSGPIDEGGAATISVSASDPAGINDPLSYEFDCDDNGVYEIGPQPTNSASCSYADNGAFTVNVRVTDGDWGADSAWTVVTVNNVAPTIHSVSNSGPIDEPGSAIVTVSASDPAGVNDPLSYEFDCDGDSLYEVGPQPANSASCSYNDDGAYTVNVRVSDDDGGVSVGSTLVTVNNIAPTIDSVTNSGPINEGDSAIITVNATDPVDPLNYEFDCDNDGVYEIGPQAANMASCSFSDNGLFTVNVRVTDGDGGEALASTVVTVNNVAPAIDAVTNDGPIDEGSAATISVSASDPAGINDPLSYEFDCDDNGVYEIGPQPANSAACSYADNGAFTVNVRVSDGDGGATSASTIVTVNNVPPAVDAGPDVTISLADTFVLNATFTDPGILDAPFTATIDWGDGLVQAGVVGAGAVAGSHRYQGQPDTNHVTVCVTDKDGATGCDSLNVITLGGPPGNPGPPSDPGQPGPPPGQDKPHGKPDDPGQPGPPPGQQKK